MPTSRLTRGKQVLRKYPWLRSKFSNFSARLQALDDRLTEFAYGGRFNALRSAKRNLLGEVVPRAKPTTRSDLGGDLSTILSRLRRRDPAHRKQVHEAALRLL